MDELFSTYKAVEPMLVQEEIEIPDLNTTSRYDTFLETLNRYREAQGQKQPEVQKQDDNQNWFTNTKIRQTTPSVSNLATTIDYTTKDLQTMLNEQGLDKYIRITSGFRDHNVGKAGNRSNHRKKNKHGHSMAYDIAPAQGETFDSIYQKMKENPAMQQWLSQNGFNINDETDTATLRRTGGTGAHFHIGPDKFNIRKGQSGFDTSNLFSAYKAIELPIKPIIKPVIPNIEYSSTGVPDAYIGSNTPTQQSEQKADDNQSWFSNTKLREAPTAPVVSPKQKENEAAINSPTFDSDFQKFGTSKIFSDHKNFWKRLAFSESSLNSQASNKSGAFGYFQIMPQSRTGADVASQFKDAEKLMTSHMSLINDEDRKLAQQKGITEEGLMAGVWLGGPGGVKKTLRSQGNAKDSNGTSVMNYMKKFS